MASKTGRGISGKALGAEISHYGAPVMVMKYASTTSAGTSNTDTAYDKNFPFRARLLRAWISMTEAGADDSEDVYLDDGTNLITDTMDYSGGSDDDNYEFSRYINAYSTLDKGATLRVVKTATTAVTSFDMYFMFVRV